jgi:hypothetical protein
LYAVTGDTQLWSRPSTVDDDNWTPIGHAYNANAMTGGAGLLWLTTEDNELRFKLRSELSSNAT